jgi:hypothetical protein
VSLISGALLDRIGKNRYWGKVASDSKLKAMVITSNSPDGTDAMKIPIASVTRFTLLLSSLDAFVASVMAALWRMVAAVVAFSNHEVSPRSFEVRERRLERTSCELGRQLLP